MTDTKEPMPPAPTPSNVTQLPPAPQRMPEKCCFTCKHYLLPAMICRAAPPQVVVSETQFDRKTGKTTTLDWRSVFPPMEMIGLCGQHKPGTLPGLPTT